MSLALLTIFGSSFVIALSGALMPGPVLTVTVSESARRGAKAGPLMIFGHGILELALVLALLGDWRHSFPETRCLLSSRWWEEQYCCGWPL